MMRTKLFPPWSCGGVGRGDRLHRGEGDVGGRRLGRLHQRTARAAVVDVQADRDAEVIERRGVGGVGRVTVVGNFNLVVAFVGVGVARIDGRGFIAGVGEVPGRAVADVDAAAERREIDALRGKRFERVPVFAAEFAFGERGAGRLCWWRQGRRRRSRCRPASRRGRVFLNLIASGAAWRAGIAAKRAAIVQAEAKSEVRQLGMRFSRRGTAKEFVATNRAGSVRAAGLLGSPLV